MFFKNATLYRLADGWQPTTEALDSALEKQRYQPIDSLNAQTLGWVSPRENGPLAHTVGRHSLIQLRIEKKLLPTAVVNKFARERAAQVEEQQGYKPGRRQMKEIKEQVYDELLPKAFSLARDVRGWFDFEHRWFVIDTSSATVADAMLGLLAKSLEPFPLIPLRTGLSPVQAMTSWLAAGEAPGGLSIDEDAHLKTPGDSKAEVRFLHQAPDPETLRQHLAAGKQCTRLALTWQDRISFQLSDVLTLRRIQPLDVLREQDNPGADEDERFDSDFALMGGELGGLLSSLAESLEETPAARP